MKMRVTLDGERSLPAQILVVDDDINTLNALQRLLQRESYEILLAQSGPEALNILQKNDVDVILCDRRMPGMDGIETIWRIRERKELRHIPIIMVTGMDTPDDIANGLDAGATDYIAKPFTGVVVNSRVRAALRTKKAHDKVCERNRKILQLAFAMTHDLQAPLASISGAIGVVRSELGDAHNPEVAKWVAMIESAAGRMAAMLDDLMSYAKLGGEETTNQPLDTIEILDGVAR